MSGYDITSVVDMYLSRDPEPAAIHGTIVAALDPDPGRAAATLLEDGRSSMTAASSACPTARPSTRRRSPSTPRSM